MKTIIILLMSIILTSCGIIDNGTHTIIKGTRIDLPKSPLPVGIKGTEGIIPENYELVEPPLVAEPFQYWRAYKDGAIIWKPRDWRIIDSYIKNSQSWMNLAKERINTHNELFKEEKVTKEKSWSDYFLKKSK